MSEKTEEKGQGRENAEAALENIMAMVKRVDHAQECHDPDECELTDEEICAGLCRYYSPGQEVNDEDRQVYHDEDEAREQIRDDAIEVSVRVETWTPPGQPLVPDVYRVLFTTGGPAGQVKGDLGPYNQPENAKIQYQDQSTPWTTLYTTQEQRDALLEYARQFPYGE